MYSQKHNLRDLLSFKLKVKMSKNTDSMIELTLVLSNSINKTVVQTSSRLSVPVLSTLKFMIPRDLLVSTRMLPSAVFSKWEYDNSVSNVSIIALKISTVSLLWVVVLFKSLRTSKTSEKWLAMRIVISIFLFSYL